MPTKIQSDLERISEFDSTLWDFLKGKRIFATGCTGFIGTWIIYSFLHVNEKYNLGAELVLLTRNKSKHEEKYPGVKFVEGEIQSFEFPEGEFDFVIHGATEVAVFQTGANSSGLLDVSFFGTKRIIEFSLKASVKKILFLSSGAAYGTQPLEMPLLEESFQGAPDMTSPKSMYGEAKRVGELLLFNQSIPSTSARIFATCGPFLPIESKYAFSNFMEAAILSKNIIINSNGKTTRSYLYIGDLVLWLWLLLLKGKDKNIYNVGSEDEISILALAEKIRTTLGKNMNIEVHGQESEYGRYIPSNKKIRSEFNIKDLVSLEDGIKNSFEFLKENYAV